MSTPRLHYKNQANLCPMICCVGKTHYEMDVSNGISNVTKVTKVTARPRREIGENEGWVTVTSMRRGSDGWKRKETVANKLLGIE